MTNEQLSKQVGELYWIGASEYNSFIRHDREVWLHEDSARVFELMCEHEIDVEYFPDHVKSSASMPRCEEYYDEHNNDKALATRIAILKCLVKIEE